MKSIKTTFIRGLSLLLALVILLSLPISAFAATDSGIETYAYSYDAARSKMIDSYIYRALKYLKYDRYNELEDNGYLFTPDYVAVDLLNKYNSGALSYYPLTDIGYNSSSSGAYGTAFTTDANGQNVPDVAEFEEKGLMCSSFVEYYFMNYLYRVEKLDVSYLMTAYEAARKRINNGTQNYGIDIWYEAAETLVADGVATVYRFDQEDSIAPDDGEDETEEHQNYMAMFDTLPIGALIRFGYPDYGSYNDEFRHYGIYAGTYNGVHYMIHIGNSRGPEITVVEYMATSEASKRSYPLAFYVFPNTVPDTYGTIEIYKSDEDGTPLAGAKFFILNTETGEDWDITTDSAGYAFQDELPMGTYTITEIEAPEGYEKVDTVWTVTLTEEDPTGGGPIYVTNTPLKGALQIIKDVLPSSAAIPDNLAGWQFNVYKNSPSYTTTICDGVMYRVKVTDANGNSVYSDSAALATEEATELAPIIITTQPQNTSVSAGSTAKFTVEATSTLGKTLTYQWYYRSASSTTWTKSTTTSGQSATYSFGMYTSYDARYVKCLISDGTNEIWTDEVRLYLPTTLGVSSNPSDATAIIGTSVTFTASFFASPTSYIWQYSADGGTTWTNCSDDAPFTCTNYTTTSMSVTASDDIAGYQFRCVATKGTATATTNAATLTTTPAYIFTASPSKGALVEIGETANFYVGVSGGNLSYQWQIWTAESGEWTNIEGANTSYTLSLTMTEEYSNSRVRLQITQGEYVIYSTPITFATPDTLCILTHPSSVTSEDGEEVTLSVTANGEGLVYEWEISTDGGNTWSSAMEPILDSPYSTREDGIVKISGVPIGDYYVQEIDTGRADWIYDLTPKAVTVVENTTVSVTFTNEMSTGDATIIKVTEDGSNLDGWLFSIYSDQACTNLIAGPKYTTNGSVSFTDLTAGVYWIKEEGNVDASIEDLYFCAGENPKQVVILPNETTEVRFENDLERGALEIQKVTNTGDRKDGWKVHVKQYVNGSFVEIDGSPFTTDSTGYLLVEDLLPGIYMVYEEDNGSDYWICDAKPQKVTVTAGQTTGPITITNTVYGKLTIKKTTTDGSSPERYKFNVYDPDGNLVTGSPFSPDSEGKIDVGYVLPGMYTVEEVLADDDAYEIVGDSRQAMEVKPETETVFSFVNAPKVGTLVIQKQTNTGNNLGGWQFNVYDPSGDLLAGSPFTTNDDGKITISNLPIGTYTVAEINDGKEMWIYDLEAKSAEVPHNGTATVTVTNTQLGGGQIIKDTTNGGTKAGWKFKVWTSSADYGVFTTDANGEIDLGLLYPGTYYVQEVGHVSMSAEELSYWTMDTQVKELNVVAGTTTSMTITNEWFGSGKIVKITNSGTKEGWQFKIWTDTAELGIFTTNANGEIALDKLAPGTYYVQEIGHATMTAEQLAFWIMDTEVKTVNIVAGETSNVTISNVQFGTVVIEKTTTDSSSVENWRFDITDSDGNTTTNYTDAEGRIPLMLLPGTYTITEVIAAEVMYEPQNGADVTIEIVAGEIKVVSYVNDPILGRLIINKTDGNGNPVSHAGFVAVDSKGTRYSFIESDTTPGLYILSDIPIDTYIITEEVVPPGFQISGDNEWTAILSKDHREETLNITNTALGKGQIIKEMSDGSTPAGWVFDIYRISDNTLIGTFTTGSDGTFITDYLLPGDYRVVERVPENSIYHPVGGAEKTLTVVAGETASVKFVNTLRAGEIVVNKVDGSTDAALAGAKFLLEWLDNDVWTPVIYSETVIPGGCASVGLENGCLVSDENGQIAFYGLHPDCQYRLTEIDAPDGYILQAGSIFEGALPSDTLSSTHTVYNHPVFALPATGVNNDFHRLGIFALCLLAAFVLAVGYALNTIWVTRGKKHRK